MIEAEFVKKIHAEMSRPGTCVAGYNNIRFDDELTRYSFYRNFLDPYAREWQNGNSRWDIIDLVRTCYALRPDGIKWAYNEDNVPTFKLELLSKANGIAHEDAHDALADVHATIALAKLIKAKQPKLYQYLFNLRNKHRVADQINLTRKTPLVHISSKLPAANGCCTWIAPICPHPSNKNAVICVNLALPVEPLETLSVDELKAKMYKRSEDMAPGESRLPVKLIHLNKCPVVATGKTLSKENAERLGIDRDMCLSNYQKLLRFEGLEQTLSALFETPNDAPTHDADHALYTGGFLNDHDRQLCQRIQDAAPENLDGFSGQFTDQRMETLLFRYRGRNYPQLFNAQELQQWQAHRQYRISDPASPAGQHLSAFIQELETLMQAHAQNKRKFSILKDLYQYAQQL